MPARARDVDYAPVNKLGFIREESAHHIYTLRIAGSTVAQTLISHSAHEIDDGLLASMARQIRITRRQFAEILRCTLERSDYLRLLGISE